MKDESWKFWHWKVEIEKRENDCGEIRQKLITEVENLKEKMEVQEQQRQTEKGMCMSKLWSSWMMWHYLYILLDPFVTAQLN